MLTAGEIVSQLKTRALRYLPGEHDAALDNGSAYREQFGPTYYAFEHKGIHFIALDNVSDPGARLGAAQLSWLKTDLAGLAGLQNEARIVIFTHRPLFDLAPQWDWATRDGAQALALMSPFKNVTVFYGHAHQELHHTIDHITHHAASSLIFPLPLPGSQESPMPLAWDPALPGRGLGFREIGAHSRRGDLNLIELSLAQGRSNGKNG